MQKVNDAEMVYRAWKQSGGRERSLKGTLVTMFGAQDEL